MRRVWPLALTIAVIVSACGGDSSEPTESTPTDETSPKTDSTSTTSMTSTTAVEEPDEGTETTEGTSGGSSIGNGGCTISVSGDVDETLEYPDSDFFSDYWSSEEELRDYIEFLGEDIAEGTYEEVVASGKPVVGWFLLTCTDPQDPGPGVQVFHTNDTTRDQFPMAPATYPVSGGQFEADGQAGTVITNLALTLEEQFDPIPDSGELVISQWDSSILEGVLTFDGRELFAEGDPRMVSVTVDYVIECAPPTHTACG